jgi:hypothetical protein
MAVKRKKKEIENRNIHLTDLQKLNTSNLNEQQIHNIKSMATFK